MTSGVQRVRHARTRTARGQRGAGLIEVLIACAVMAPLILAAAMGLLTGIRASANAELAQRVGVAVTTATENLKAMPYLPCASAEEYQTAYTEWLGERTPKVLDEHQLPEPRIREVTYWDEASASYTPKCSRDGGAQRFTVSVTIDGRTTEANIVTRDPAPSVTGSTEELRR